MLFTPVWFALLLSSVHVSLSHGVVFVSGSDLTWKKLQKKSCGKRKKQILFDLELQKQSWDLSSQLFWILSEALVFGIV